MINLDESYFYDIYIQCYKSRLISLPVMLLHDILFAKQLINFLLDSLAPQSRLRDNSYSSKSGRVSIKAKTYGKQISITGKVLVKTSLPTKSVSSISEDDELDQGN